MGLATRPRLEGDRQADPKELLPSVLWVQLLKQIRNKADIAAQFGFDIIIKPLPEKAY